MKFAQFLQVHTSLSHNKVLVIFNVLIPHAFKMRTQS